ncbi:MAG: DUF2798 domain-containing protein [Pseudomonadota bacterium]
MIPPRYAPYVFGLLLSGVMSLMVSGISTFRAIGMPGEFLPIWGSNWVFSWAVAFPTLLAMKPLVQRLVGAMTAAPREKVRETA